MLAGCGMPERQKYDILAAAVVLDKRLIARKWAAHTLRDACLVRALGCVLSASCTGCASMALPFLNWKPQDQRLLAPVVL